MKLKPYLPSIALALASINANAQSSVTFYGILSEGIACCVGMSLNTPFRSVLRHQLQASAACPVATMISAETSLRFDTVTLSGMRRGFPG